MKSSQGWCSKLQLRAGGDLHGSDKAELSAGDIEKQPGKVKSKVIKNQQ